MSKRRKAIPLRTKLAAALLQILRPDENGNLVPVIPYEEAKTLTDSEIISRFELDHFPLRKIDGGPDEPWNLVYRPKAEHREKTRKIDIPAAAKSRRIEKRNALSAARIRAKLTGEPVVEKPKRKWPKRKFPKGRGFQKRGER